MEGKWSQIFLSSLFVCKWVRNTHCVFERIAVWRTSCDGDAKRKVPNHAWNPKGLKIRKRTVVCSSVGKTRETARVGKSIEPEAGLKNEDNLPNPGSGWRNEKRPKPRKYVTRVGIQDESRHVEHKSDANASSVLRSNRNSQPDKCHGQRRKADQEDQRGKANLKCKTRAHGWREESDKRRPMFPQFVQKKPGRKNENTERARDKRLFPCGTWLPERPQRGEGLVVVVTEHFRFEKTD